MALRNKIPSILQHIDRHSGVLEYNYRLYRAYEGQIKREIEDSMAQEIISQAALKRALQRIPSINILKKAVDKISTVYSEPVKRVSKNATDREIMSNIVKIGRLDVTMMYADIMANLQKMAAIEPYVEDGMQKFRVYGGHQFLPYGDDPLNPMKMTVFIKLMGKTQKVVEVGDQVNSDSGIKNKKAATEIREVNMYMLYSDQEVLLIDSTGDVLIEKMQEWGISTVNEFGVIPQTYINKSHFELVPFPDTSGLDTAILIPKLLTDLNYAVQFQSHSILWVKNADLGNQEINPDTVIDLGERVEGGGEPDMGVIQPKVDIEGVLQMVEFELNGYLSSIGLKTGSLNGLKSGREVSGIAKAIDEGDTTLVRRKNIDFFKEVEAVLWEKISICQNIWSAMGLLEKESRKFSSNPVEDFTTIFGEVKIIETIQDKVMKIEAQDRLGVITKKDIIKDFNPDFTDDQIQKRLKEIEEDRKKRMEEMKEEFANGTAANGSNNDSDEIQFGAERADSSGDNNDDNKQDG